MSPMTRKVYEIFYKFVLQKGWRLL